MGEGGLLGLPDPVERGLRPKIPLVGIGEASSFADVGSSPSGSMTSSRGPLLTADPLLSFRGEEESIEIGAIVGEGGPLDLPDALVEPGLSPTIALVGIGVDSSSMEVGFNPSRSMISRGRSLFLAESKGEFDDISLPSGRSGIGEVALSIVIVLTASGNAIAVGGGLGRHFLMARPRSSNPTVWSIAVGKVVVFSNFFPPARRLTVSKSA